MKKIVILSGKGGTGKTTITYALTQLVKSKFVVDADVDAADLFILLMPQAEERIDFYSGKVAEIYLDKCTKCGLCQEVCRFDAITNFVVDTTSCEGCGFCFNVCPANAIHFQLAKCGDIFKTKLSDDNNFLYAKLLPGKGNSGKLVTELKKLAVQEMENAKKDWMIIDGPPGIGCPVNASVAGTDLALIITEPTKSAFEDLKRLVILLRKFEIYFGLVINKYDLNPEITMEIKNYCKNEKINIFGQITFDYRIVQSLQTLKKYTDYPVEMKNEVANIWNKIEIFFNN